MTKQVKLSHRAKHDLRAILQWITPRSSVGAARWLAAFNHAVQHIAVFAAECSAAEEADRFQQPLKQHVFKTRRGNLYRLIFSDHGDVSTILAIRGAGQDWLRADEVEFD